jgi:hypothetical protein
MLKSFRFDCFAAVLAAMTVSAAASTALAAQPTAKNTLCVEAAASDVEAADLPYEGKISQAQSCHDKEGRHLYFATQTLAVPSAPDVGASEVHFYQYTQMPDGTYKKRWEGRDFVPGPGATIQILNFQLLDLNQDGLTEAYIGYTVSSAADNADEAKLLIYVKERKTAIRGAIARRAEDYASRSLDENFKQLPPEIQQHALTLWDELSLPPSVVR